MGMKDYLILAISFYNCRRPAVLVNLTNEQVRTATTEPVPGPESYYTMLASRHKSKLSGEATVSVPPLNNRELGQFQRLTGKYLDTGVVYSNFTASF